MTKSEILFTEKANKEDDLNGDSSGNKEQYVTVITLNDSTYGEIKKSKASPKQAGKPAAEEIEESLIEAKVTELSKCTPPGSEVGQKTEPIYLNTLETKKPAEKGKIHSSIFEFLISKKIYFCV